MKILFVASVFGHITAFHKPYIKLLQNKGYDVYVACNETKSNKIAKIELEEMDVKCLNIEFTRSPFTFNTLKAFKQLKSLLKSTDFHMIHVHTPTAALLTRFVNNYVKKVPVIYTAHGFHFHKGAPVLNWLVYYPLERLAARWTDTLITINNEDYERAMKTGFSRRSINYVHGVGVESTYRDMTNEAKQLLKQSLGILEDAVVISYVAEINKNKNHQFLLKNWNRIKEASPAAVLLFIGEGDLSAEIERFISEEKLEDVYLLGFRNDVHELLQITDVVSLLSYREGLPKSIMEAMVSHVSCVVSDTRGLRDLISNGRNGYVVAHGDDITLVESFVTLLNDKEKRLTMGAAAHQDVQPYRLENVLQEYIAIYDDILGKE